MHSTLVSATVLLFSVAIASAGLRTEEVFYHGGGVALKGYLAWDDTATAPRPGVLVVHEWWGQNEYVRMRARKLAELGYVALAIDMYGEGKLADHPQDAGQFAGDVMANLDTARKRFEAALNCLNQRPEKDPGKTAAIGYCFGGGVVLHMARLGVDLRGVASFHGSLDAKATAKPGVVKARVLVCNGADDIFVTAEAIQRFKQEMENAGVDYDFISYPGARHAFTNPEATAAGEKFGLPIAYQKEADEASWQALKEFLVEVFAP